MKATAHLADLKTLPPKPNRSFPPYFISHLKVLNLKTACCYLFLLAIIRIHSPVFAAPAAIVRQIHGQVYQVTPNGKQQLNLAVLLDPGTKLYLAPKSRLALLFFATNDIIEISGNGELKLTAQGVLPASKGSRLKLKKTTYSFISSDDAELGNPILMGGTTVRSRPFEVTAPFIYNLHITTSPSHTWEITWECRSPDRFEVTINPEPAPDALSDFISFNKIAGTASPSGHYYYKVTPDEHTPKLQEGKRYKLEIFNSDDERVASATLRVLSEHQRRLLDAIDKKCSQWSLEEPENPLPWQVKAATYEEFDQLEKALEATRSAFALISRASYKTQPPKGLASKKAILSRLRRLLKTLCRWDDPLLQ